MAATQPRVFNIPASAPFLAVLIDALRAGKLVPGFPASREPLELARATLYLPTRRACRLARDVFLDRLDGDAAILPRIVPLGDLDEDEIAFAQAATAELAETALSLPPAIEPLERRLLLAELILKWANSAAMRGAAGSPLVANTVPAALGLADDLARLMDDMTTRQVSWDALDTLVPDDLDHYWQRSLDFLKIAREVWPLIRGERGAIEAAERRDLLIEAEAQRLAGSDAPVIAAGSTGSMPATAKLLATIASLPHGAVVLPGLDMHLDETSWQRISGDGGDKTHDGAPAAGHAQFALQALLQRMNITRAEVTQLGASGGREALVSEALRPAATTEHWQLSRKADDFNSAVDSALGTLAVIEAANAEEEALAIAVAIRETLETPQKTVALVTPDRALARRVLAALERWRIAVDDSGGDSLADTAAGRFARLAATAAIKGLEPVTVLALLKHPLLRLGAEPSAHDVAIAALERALLRGPRPKPGTQALKDALVHFRGNRDEMHRSDPRWLIDEDALDAAADLIERLAAALVPLESLMRDHPLAKLAAGHRQAIVALAGEEAFDGVDGRALVDALDELIASPSAQSLAIARGDYPDVFHAAIGDRVVRRPETRDVRVHIYGPLEARLQMVDRVILGGLNEATWPPETRSDPWLSRPMRRDLGLDPPERRIGLSAHDFAQALGMNEAILTRAQKLAGAPTVTSRFVQRIAALAGEERWQTVVERGNAYLELVRALDQPAQVKAVARPEPKPPLEARPTKLSVTAIEDWLRDPYTIYARYILRLMPLDAVDTPPGARDRGTIIHGAIGDYTRIFAAAPPADPIKELRALGDERFKPLADYPEARAFWEPRYERIARWFAQWDGARRDSIAALHAEIRGELSFNVGARTFTLSAVADRIEKRIDGTYDIVDYKTGQARTEKQVRTGLAPQLTLEAAILRAGGFKAVPAGSVSAITYVTLKGGEPAGKEQPIDFKEGTPDTQADHALEKLKALAATFENKDAPYLSLVHPMWRTHYGDYDHLARVKEWSLTGGTEEGEG
ncbi:double-strand break repair protein AddB [Microbacteriaceae bacterium K1510]|nr:double-strand break repair protein AddB [Microbacteriaceae bacterium K1510]